MLAAAVGSGSPRAAAAMRNQRRWHSKRPVRGAGERRCAL